MAGNGHYVYQVEMNENHELQIVKVLGHPTRMEALEACVESYRRQVSIAEDMLAQAQRLHAEERKHAQESK